MAAAKICLLQPVYCRSEIERLALGRASEHAERFSHLRAFAASDGYPISITDQQEFRMELNCEGDRIFFTGIERN
jgi:hypothetical protein